MIAAPEPRKLLLDALPSSLRHIHVRRDVSETVAVQLHSQRFSFLGIRRREHMHHISYVRSCGRSSRQYIPYGVS